MNSSIKKSPQNHNPKPHGQSKSLTVLRRLEPSDVGKGQQLNIRLNLVPLAVPAEIFSDRTSPLLANPPVWKGWWFTLSERVENHLFAKIYGAAAMKCHLCGQRKKSVRSRKTITIGLQTGTVRWQFCDECAAIVNQQSPLKK